MAGQPSTLFNHQYRVRPTTVDQKRVKIKDEFRRIMILFQNKSFFFFTLKKLTRSSKINEKTLKSAITQRKSIYESSESTAKSLQLKSKGKKSDKQFKIDDRKNKYNIFFFNLNV